MLDHRASLSLFMLLNTNHPIAQEAITTMEISDNPINKIFVDVVKKMTRAVVIMTVAIHR